ncbi:hypothetical protein [Propionibacterium freudenreichii]|uniref:hypothetical protein n=1 Tax=Propionibacterium freudenreichii TaxID=1744 RepID=UPI0038527470
MSFALPVDMTPIRVKGLSPDDQDELTKLMQIWATKAERNGLRRRYYDGHARLRDLGISIPPQLKHTPTVVGWPAKAVDTLASRSMFDGFVVPGAGDDDDPLELKPILDANSFDQLYATAVVSELIHCCAFLTVTLGDTQLGDPPVLISPRSAEYAAARWDMRRRQIRSGMAVVDVDSSIPSQPTMVTLYLADKIITCAKSSTNQWEVAGEAPNHLGRPLMEPMPFRPDDARPFGKSRISREIMSITDSAQRAALRAEVLMEFNTAPQKYLLGADEELFQDGSRWKSYMDAVLAISRDEDDNLPTFGQLSQVSPTGAISYLQHLAARFAGATGLPVSSLGIVSDNPSSAQAISQARDDLVTEAQSMNRVNNIALTNVARMALAIRDGITLDALPDQARGLRAKFRNPAMPSVVSQSDAMVKQISAIPWLANTRVALEELGYNEEQVTRLLADKRRAQASDTLASMLAGGEVGHSQSGDSTSAVPRPEGRAPVRGEVSGDQA